MEDSHERLHSDQSRQIVRNLLVELRKLEDHDVKEPLYPLGKSILRSRTGLYYRPHPYLFGEGLDRRVLYQHGEFLLETGYSRKGVEDFLQTLVATSRTFSVATDYFVQTLARSEINAHVVEFYLLMFCYHLLMEKRNEPIDASVDRFIDWFAKDDFSLQFRIGIDGIILGEKEVLLHDSLNERALIRQPEPSDLSMPVLVREPWIPGTDLEGVYPPQFPAFSSVIVLQLKHPTIIPREFWLFDVRLPSRFRTLDWILDAIGVKINEMSAILSTFQTKTAPRFPYLDFQFHSKAIGEDYPLYQTRMEWQRQDYQIPSFAITSENSSNLQMFWKKMVERNILERIYGPPSPSPWTRTLSPTRVAFEEYHKIISSSLDERERVRDAMLTLEGFFAYKKGHKLFAQLLLELFKVTGIRDPNDTTFALGLAYRIRNKGVHRGLGWEDRENPSSGSDLSRYDEGDYRAAVRQHQDQAIANLALNYLRIALVARIIARCTDMEFVKRLTSTDGQRWLMDELQGTPEIVSGDPIPNLSLKPRAQTTRVYVDAKIVGRHDTALPKQSFVGYVVHDYSGLCNVKEVVATETDDAELQAVAFALQELKDRIQKFTILCDHESVVSVINRNGSYGKEKRPTLQMIRDELRTHPSIKVMLLAKNPAHRLLNAHLTKFLNSKSKGRDDS